MARQAFQLVMRSGPNPGKIFDLNQAEMSIGRDISNDIVINDAEVSRKHARLIAQTGGYVLEDTGSTNGTFVNGQRLMGPHLLRPGELLLLGENVSLTYEQLAYDPDATVATVSGVPNLPPSGPAAPVYTPPSSYEQPRQTPPAPPPIYTGSVPPGPAEAYVPYEEEEAQGVNRTWVLAGCGCLTVVACLTLVAVLFYIDAGGTERWCQYLGFLFPSCP